MKQIFRSFVPRALCLAGFLLLCAGNPTGLLLFILGALIVWRPQAALFTFPTNCEGRLIEVSKSTGCSLSAATIRPWLTSDLEGAALKEIGYDSVFGQLREARVAGYRESTLSELVMSRATNIKRAVTRQNIAGNESMVDPFVKFRQKRNINSQYFLITAGTPTPGAGAGGIPASAWDLTVTNQTGTFATTLPTLANFFLPGGSLLVDYGSSANVALHLQYKIISAATVAGVTTVTVEPNYSPAGWAALSAANKLKYQIGGLAGGAAQAGTGAYLGANSVSDYESYRDKYTALNPNSVIQFPIQTSRIVWDYTDQWLKLLKNPLMGEYFKTFWQLPEAQQRAQAQAEYERQIMHSFFYGQRETELQAPTTYDQLPLVYDPANANCPLEYKTRVEGVQTQLINCGRYRDLAGAPLDADTFFSDLYLLKRAREADSTDVTGIDVMCGRGTAGVLERFMNRFYQQYYSQQNYFPMRMGEVMDVNRKVKVFNYREYDIPDEFGGFQLRVFSHNYFSDRLGAFGGAPVHNQLWAIDWSDMMFGVVATNSRSTKTNLDDELYRYVMKVNAKYVQMNSMTWACCLEDPNRHMIYRNFSNECLTKTIVAGCDIPNPPAT